MCTSGPSVADRPKPKRRRIGLIGGTGGGADSIPFFRDAPGGRSTVSMTDVVDKKIGSEMSALATDFLRSVPLDGIIAPALAWKDCPIGVEVPETGGVLWAEKGRDGGIGDV